MFTRLREDIDCILERDPAARSRWEVLTCYPGLHALWMHRIAHGCWNAGLLTSAGWSAGWFGYHPVRRSSALAPIPSAADRVDVRRPNHEGRPPPGTAEP